MKIIALANDPDGIEKCINDYFCSTSYELVLVKRINDKTRKVDEVKYILENKSHIQNLEVLKNIDEAIDEYGQDVEYPYSGM